MQQQQALQMQTNCNCLTRSLWYIVYSSIHSSLAVSLEPNSGNCKFLHLHDSRGVFGTSFTVLLLRYVYVDLRTMSTAHFLQFTWLHFLFILHCFLLCPWRDVSMLVRSRFTWISSHSHHQQHWKRLPLLYRCLLGLLKFKSRYSRLETAIKVQAK